MKKMIILVMFTGSLFGGADMCSYYYKLISAATQKALFALERGDIDYAEAYASEVVRNSDAAIVECQGVIPDTQMKSLHKVRDAFLVSPRR